MIILAAGSGKRLWPVTQDKPKCLTMVGSKPILEWQIEIAHSCGITDIYVVGGYKIEQLESFPIKLVNNDRFHCTNMVYSLFCASPVLEGQVIISYGDILYSKNTLLKMMNSMYPMSIGINTLWRSYWEKRFINPLDDAESLKLNNNGEVINIGMKVNNIDEIEAQYMGLLSFQKEGISQIKEFYAALSKKNLSYSENLSMTEFLQNLIDANHVINTVPIDGNWVEIDQVNDIIFAEEFVTNTQLIAV